MKQKIAVATINSWNIDNALKFKRLHAKRYDTSVIAEKQYLTYAAMKKLGPRYIFFPHWSWMIPEDIYKNFECVLFHMTDLPFGRGGTPLQNLILRGLKHTKISAIKVSRGVDAGPVYLKRPLSLSGTAQEIYKRASDTIFDSMMPYILRKKPRPLPQKGKAVFFKRRTPQESRIPADISLQDLYNHIRMLDAKGYPAAFIDYEGLRLEFWGAKKEKNGISAKVFIRKGAAK
jgi:methionyl-tRNA formyltransferase